MLVFSNKFSVVLNQDKSEAIITFYQNTPVLPEGGQQTVGAIPSQVVPVASIAMTGQCATSLNTVLTEILNRE